MILPSIYGPTFVVSYVRKARGAWLHRVVLLSNEWPIISYKSHNWDHQWLFTCCYPPIWPFLSIIKSPNIIQLLFITTVPFSKFLWESFTKKFIKICRPFPNKYNKLDLEVPRRLKIPKKKSVNPKIKLLNPIYMTMTDRK